MGVNFDCIEVFYWIQRGRKPKNGNENSWKWNWHVPRGGFDVSVLGIRTSRFSTTLNSVKHLNTVKIDSHGHQSLNYGESISARKNSKNRHLVARNRGWPKTATFWKSLVNRMLCIPIDVKLFTYYLQVFFKENTQSGFRVLSESIFLEVYSVGVFSFCLLFQ